MNGRGASNEPLSIVGAGLAGSECAWQLARRGVAVRLLEMKPKRYSPAHQLPGPAELVCSNSLKSDDPETAHGQLKWELRGLDSLIMQAADKSRVPAGSALAVDRRRFGELVAERLSAEPGLDYRPGVEVTEPPAGRVVLCTGPLTAERLAAWLQTRSGRQLYFYDALAPIIAADSIDRGRVFAASRWGKGSADQGGQAGEGEGEGEGDYLNCPLDKERYRKFLQALREAPQVPVRDFEPEHFFEGCLPIEELARRGDDTLAFGPMRPVGLSRGGRRPYAVVQLRAENSERSAYNLVGFQTRLTQPGQRRVFRLIPGLERARFLRYGAMHRNLYVDAPRVLDERLALRTEPRVHLAGQIVGVEGYLESTAVGLLLALLLAARQQGRAWRPPPPSCALGALWNHVRRPPAPGRAFEPMNIHFGLLPEVSARGRRRRRQARLERARRDFAAWRQELEAGT